MSNFFKENDVYEILKKYDWNEKVTEAIVNGYLKKLEEAGDFEGWTEVKKTEKQQPQKPHKEHHEHKGDRKFQKKPYRQNHPAPADNEGAQPRDSDNQHLQEQYQGIVIQGET